MSNFKLLIYITLFKKVEQYRSNILKMPYQSGHCQPLTNTCVRMTGTAVMELQFSANFNSPS